MTMDRRHLFRLTGGLTAGATLASALFSDARAAPPTLAPLVDAGFDPFEVYVRMFASLENNDMPCWWFNGGLPIEIEEIGQVDTVQEETIRAHLSTRVDADTVVVDWMQAGVFRHIGTGEVPPEWINPITGTSARKLGALGGAPSRFTVSRTGPEGLSIDLDIEGTEVAPILVSATIDGDRLGLTHIEDKTREGRNGPTTLRTVFKLYASLADVRSDTPSINAAGFYGVRNLGTGQVFVNGHMNKARADEPYNPIAWERIKVARPDFFDGNRVAPNWG